MDLEIPDALKKFKPDADRDLVMIEKKAVIDLFTWNHKTTLSERCYCCGSPVYISVEENEINIGCDIVKSILKNNNHGKSCEYYGDAGNCTYENCPTRFDPDAVGTRRLISQFLAFEIVKILERFDVCRIDGYDNDVMYSVHFIRKWLTRSLKVFQKEGKAVNSYAVFIEGDDAGVMPGLLEEGFVDSGFGKTTDTKSG